MDIERRLISKAIQSQAVENVISRGIESDHFADNECRNVWEFITDHMRQYKSAPSSDIVREQFRDFSFELTTDTLDYLTDRFVKDVKRRLAIQLGREYRDAIDDPDEVENIEVRALEMARQLTEVVPSPKVTRFSEMDQRIREYERKLAAGEVSGIKMGIPTFDNLTLGIQPHEYVTIAAFLGVGKSTMMQHMFYQAYLQGKTPLLISLEMEASAIMRKFDVMATSVQYHAMKALELDDEDKYHWEEVAELASSNRHERDIIVIDDIRHPTVDDVMAATIRYKPDIVGVDYVGMMDAPRGSSATSWEKLTHITRGLKSNARTLKVPIVAAAQGNRDFAKEGANLWNLAQSISVGQDSDIVIGLQRDEDMIERDQMEAILMKQRDGISGKSVIMNWKLDTMDIRERTTGDIFGVRVGVPQEDASFGTTETATTS